MTGNHHESAQTKAVKPLSELSTAQLLQKVPFPLLSKLHEIKVGVAYLEPSPPDSPTSKHKTEHENEQSMLELMLRYADRATEIISGSDDEGMSARKEVLRLLIDYIEKTILATRNIHTVLASFQITISEKSKILRSYYEALHTANVSPGLYQSSLFGRKDNNVLTEIYTVFGGQGLRGDRIEELRELVDTYPSLTREIVHDLSSLLIDISRTSDITNQLLPQGVDILSWLHNPSQVPDSEYLNSAPVSVPLIGFVQLVHYEVTCKTLGCTPGQLRSHIAGTTGHSQGIIIAAATVIADDWSSWREATRAALTTLFWVGIRTQQIWNQEPNNSISEAMIQDSIDHGERKPSPMLSIRGLAKTDLQKCIDATNRYLKNGNRTLSVSMTNAPHHFVVSGPPKHLYGLNLQIRKTKKLSGASKPDSVATMFLPVSVPFHTSWLHPAVPMIQNDLKHVSLHRCHFKIPVFSTENGQNVSQENGSSVLHELVELVVSRGLHWGKATAHLHPEHILGVRTPVVLDFGPGGVHGISAISKSHTGSRIILAGTLSGQEKDVGYKADLFG